MHEAVPSRHARGADGSQPRGVRLRGPSGAQEVGAPTRRARHEHGEIKDAHYGSAVSFRDPDGIALEFFAPPG
jgi:hypothetical protein